MTAKILKLVMILLFTQSTNAGNALRCDLKQAPYQQNIQLPEHKEGYAKTSGGTMFFRYFEGQPGPLVILIPGLPASVYYSDLIARLVQAGYNVLSFDYPGKMNSNLKGKANAQFLKEQVKELFSALKVEKHGSWSLIGTSMGGILASDLAFHYQKHVKNLILLNPVGLDGKWSLTQKVAFVPILREILAPFIMKKEVKKDVQNALACPQNYLNLLNEQDQYLASNQSKWNYLNLISNYGMRSHPEIYKALNRLQIPILVTSGELKYDKFAYQINQLKQLLPRAKYMIIQGTSHIPFVENPEETFHVIMDFYKKPNILQMIKN